MDARHALRRVLDDAPGSIRELADEAGVSDMLLRAIRDGDRRMTAETRDKLASALRRWGSQCNELAEVVESADVSPSAGGDDG